MTKIIFVSILYFSFISNPHAKNLSSGGDAKLTIAGRAVGNPHNDIERAGIILLKDYGHDVPGKPMSRYAVILGHTRGSADHYNFQGGKCDQSDKHTTITASRETVEETGGLVKISASQLSKQPYIVHGKKQLFVVRNDQLSVRQISKACAQACNNPKLPHCYREVDHVVAVPLLDLLKLATHIKNNNVHPKFYIIYSRTANKHVRVDGYYMRMIVHRLPEMRSILNHLFPKAHF